jgi:phage tail-like protein
MSDIKLLGTSRQRELFPKHQFLVYIGTTISAAFQKCSELSQETAKIEYWEGGSTIPWKVPGRTTITDVTLERGASSSVSFYNWAMQVSDASVGRFPTRGAGDLTDLYMQEVLIEQKDRDGTSDLAIWRLKSAWPQKFVAGDWDATADEVVIESLTLTFDFFERTF